MPGGFEFRPSPGRSQADIDAAVATEAAARAAADALLVPLTQKGAASGVASLDANSKVPVAQAPAASLLAGQAPGLFWRTGFYYFATPFPLVSTSAAMGVGTMRLGPMWVPRDCTIDRLGAEVSVTGDVGSKVRLGIYADDGNGAPGALVIDAGQIAGDSATVQELTISQALTRGLYWAGGVVQSVSVTQPTVRTVANSSIVGSSGAPAAGGGSFAGYGQTGVTGALPANITSLASGMSTALRVHVRVSA